MRCCNFSDKIIETDTFIIVAFICNDNMRPLSKLSVISFSKKSTRALTLILEASMTSPSRRARDSFRTTGAAEDG